MRGVRARLSITLVALVAVTAAVLGVGSYWFVDTSLHQRLLDQAREEATFDLTVLAPSYLADGGQAGVQRLADAVALRNTRLVVDDTGTSGFANLLSASFRDLVRAGQLAYEWATIDGRPELVLGGTVPPSGPVLYFRHDASAIESTLSTFRLALVGGVVVLVLIALATARVIARGVLAPVAAAGDAAERIAEGDLSARIPVTSRDEFGRWAARFNHMAETLDETVARLRASQAQNRRFVADVSHELRTPLTALVAEASILREHLAALPPDAERAGELLVGDVARLRVLVEQLMELSRFDAQAEQVVDQDVDVARLARAIVAARLPAALVHAPDSVVLRSDPRRFERILGNLLDNAREHAPGAAVDVWVGTDGPDLVVSVADRGPGVAPDRLGSIFDRFYKADPSRSGGSSGLGLAIAAENAALLGGTLRAANREEGGLRFDLRLPVTGPLPRGDGPAKAGFDAGGRSIAQEPSR